MKGGISRPGGLEMTLSSRGLKGREISILICFLFLLAFYSLQPKIAFAAQERVEAVDTDKDGKPDEWRYYQGQELVRVERDLDHDGKPEVRIWMKNGKPERSEVDRNGDGKPDLIRFFKDGKPERDQADLNLDGKPDAWIYYKDGVKDLMIMDKNFDGKPDAWFYYGQGGTKLVAGKLDEKFDGKSYRTFGTLPKEEKREPW